MTTWSYEDKLEIFLQFKNLGEELYDGFYFEEVGHINYEDEVTEFVESLTKSDHEQLQSVDAGFYMSLICFSRSIWMKNYQPTDWSKELEDETEDDLNVIHE